MSGKLTLEPDEHMKWIYDIYHPDYNSDYAKELRMRRAFALNSCPRWMKESVQTTNYFPNKPESCS